MGLELPKARFSAPPQPKRRQVPIDQIIQVMGNNPLASALQEDVTPALSKALGERAQRRRDMRVVGTLAEAAGEAPPDPTSGLTPSTYEGLLRIKNDRSAKRSQAAKDRVALELQMEGIRKGYTEIDPVTRKERQYLGVQGLEIQYDEEGNPFIFRGSDYAPATVPKIGGGGSGKAGRNQQVGVTPEGNTVSFNPDKKVNEVATPDGKGGYSVTPYFGAILPKTMGPEEQRGVGFASTGTNSLGRVKEIFQARPGAFTEFKGIKFTPGRVYQQISSPDAKEAFTHAQNLIQAEAYATTGKAMNEKELENKALMFMVALNDTPGDFETRLSVANQTLQAMTMRKLPTIPINKNETPAQRKARLLQELQGAQ